MNLPSNLPSFVTKKRLIILGSILGLCLLVTAVLYALRQPSVQQNIARSGLTAITNIAQLLPIQPDTKKELEVANQLVTALTKEDNQTHTYLFLLQNTAELRPGGGFLGQYAVAKIKNGTIVSFVVEDANLLDQRITAKVTPPWPIQKMLQTHNWKFRDSNFSPDFPTNADKAQYFCRLGGCPGTNFEGVFALNSQVFDDLLAITGPITVNGVTYSSDGGSAKLEEQVEKNYLGDDVAATLVQNRKNIMKSIASQMVTQLSNLNDIPKLAEFAQTEMRNKNVMLWFKDSDLESAVASVRWDGAVDTAWKGDYLMVVDANLGALKTDAYVKRSLDYTVDWTGEHPIATMKYTYNHTATHGDWRTSDYHTYARTLVPSGSTFLERVLTGGVQTTESFGKTTFGYKVDVLIGHDQTISVKYQLPDSITYDGYQLLIQK